MDRSVRLWYGTIHTDAAEAPTDQFQGTENLFLPPVILQMIPPRFSPIVADAMMRGDETLSYQFPVKDPTDDDR